MKDTIITEIMGGKKKVLVLQILFVTCVLVTIFHKYIENQIVAKVIIIFAFFGFIISAIYIVIRFLIYKKKQKCE